MYKYVALSRATSEKFVVQQKLKVTVVVLLVAVAAVVRYAIVHGVCRPASKASDCR